MNDKRRTAIKKIKAEIEDIASRLEELLEEEREAYENLPESLQDGDKGQKMQAAIDELEEVINDLQYADDKLETAIE